MDPFASRIFSPDDQARFARLSGDINPMHMDPVAARRTQMGAPVVHGIHTLLWALDALEARQPVLAAASGVQVRFAKPVYVGDAVTCVLARRTEAEAQIRIVARSATVATVRVPLGSAPPPAVAAAEPARIAAASAPRELALGELAGLGGVLDHAVRQAEIAAAFPAAAGALGGARVQALAALSRLVGMDCPGLHSIFGVARVAFVDRGGPVSYRVTSVDERFRLVRMEVAGGGLAGEVEAFSRHPPVPQPGLASVAERVSPGEFAGVRALIIGGSRGLGEVTAKIIAAGGGRVIVTYAVGQAEALRLAAEIEAFGGQCDTLRYDATAPFEAQVQDKPDINQLYYFATGRIYQGKEQVYEPGLFRTFVAFYVDGFHELCRNLAAEGRSLSAFYPSTVFIDEDSPDFTEYAMAKAAGEALCRRLNRPAGGLQVLSRRLPRMVTDQTASVVATAALPALDVMLPLVREMRALEPAA